SEESDCLTKPGSEFSLTGKRNGITLSPMKIITYGGRYTMAAGINLSTKKGRIFHKKITPSRCLKKKPHESGFRDPAGRGNRPIGPKAAELEERLLGLQKDKWQRNKHK
ncbi:hypothetical protein AVEN_150956-1, partial [Araneus ventricosus]